MLCYSSRGDLYGVLSYLRVTLARVLQSVAGRVGDNTTETSFFLGQSLGFFQQAGPWDEQGGKTHIHTISINMDGHNIFHVDYPT